MRLLSVDWDYFFPRPDEIHVGDPGDQWQLYDWGHRETEFHRGLVWGSRATGFLLNNLPLPGLSGEQDNFWQRFRFSPRATCFVADSHSQMGNNRVCRYVTEIHSYDAHHDCGYAPAGRLELASKEPPKYWTCDNWGQIHTLCGTPVHIHYPRWKLDALEIERSAIVEPASRQIDDVQPMSEPFDRLLIVRSGAWVPPWLDANWERFIAACPIKRKVRLQPVDDRGFDMAEAQESARIHRSMLDGTFQRMMAEAGVKNSSEIGV